MLMEIDDNLADCIREKLTWEATYMNWHHITPTPPVLRQDVEAEILKAIGRYIKEWLGSILVDKMTEFSFREKEVEAIRRRIEEYYQQYVLGIKAREMKEGSMWEKENDCERKKENQ